MLSTEEWICIAHTVMEYLKTIFSDCIISRLLRPSQSRSYTLWLLLMGIFEEPYVYNVSTTCWCLEKVHHRRNRKYFSCNSPSSVPQHALLLGSVQICSWWSFPAFLIMFPSNKVDFVILCVIHLRDFCPTLYMWYANFSLISQNNFYLLFSIWLRVATE